MGLLFDRERRLRGAIASARDIAATSNDHGTRLAHLKKACGLARRLPVTPAEQMLLSAE